MKYLPIRFIYPTFQKVDRKFEKKGKDALKESGTSHRQCFSAFRFPNIWNFASLQKEKNQSLAIAFVFGIN